MKFTYIYYYWVLLIITTDFPPNIVLFTKSGLQNIIQNFYLHLQTNKCF